MRFGGKSSLMGMSLLAMVSVSTAAELGALAFGEGIFNKRQGGDTTAVSTPNGSSPAATSANSPAASSSTPEEPESSAAPSTTQNTPTPTPNPSSNNPPASSSAQSSRPNTSAAPSSSPDDSSSAAETELTTEVFSTPVVSQVTTRVTYVTRITSGTDVIDLTSVSDAVSDQTVGFSATTRVAGLNNSGSGNDNGDGGNNTGKIIGGVVGGVGGAILVGGLILVFLRLRKRKQNKVQIDDEFAGMDYKENENSRNSQPLNSSPFQNTLDQYHNPPARPNAAANF